MDWNYYATKYHIFIENTIKNTNKINHKFISKKNNNVTKALHLNSYGFTFCFVQFNK